MGESVAVVTGGAGFIGSFIVDRLISEGWKVRIFDSLDPQVHPDRQPLAVNRAVEMVCGDIRNRTLLREVTRGVEVVVHCAAAVGVAQSLYEVERYVDVNVRGTAALLDVLVEHRERPRKLVVLTSMTSYGEGLYRRPSDKRIVRVEPRSEMDIRRHGWDPICPETGEVLQPIPTSEDAALLARNVYALTKRHQEDLALAIGQLYDIPTVCLRLFNVYGPRQSLSNPYTGVLAIFLSRIVAGREPVVYEDGRQTRDFVSVHDVVSAVVRAVQSSAAEGQVVNIGTGVARQIQECARVLARLLGRDELQPQITERYRRGDVRHCYADITRARSLLGFEPKVSWEEGLMEFVEWSTRAPSRDEFARAQRELEDRGLIS